MSMYAGSIFGFAETAFLFMRNTDYSQNCTYTNLSTTDDFNLKIKVSSTLPVRIKCNNF